MALERLFTPLKLGPIEIKNRIFSTGHQTTMVNDGRVNDQLIAYHEARARGGAGLIVIEIGAIHETAFFSSHTLKTYLDESIEGYRRLADAIHKHGCKIFAQLFHPGREVYGMLPDGQRPVAYAPSETPAERYLTTPVPLALAMIETLIEGYGDCALRMKKAGLDGVEVVASHGYLPAQFLNERTNLRTDRYGGSAEGRERFIREVARRIRDKVGNDLVLGMRISGDEASHDGLTPEETLEALASFDRDATFDYFNVIAGSSSDSAGAIHIVPPMRIATGYVAPFARRVKERVSCAVFVGGRINQPQIAERILQQNEADMCAMTRAMICDPQMPQKAKQQRLDDIRACIGCNQACIGHMQNDVPISCIQFPESGRELVFGTRKPLVKRKKLMIVGGGPAGMKAAAVAAERGHEVTLFERSRRLGGQAQLAQLLPGRAEFGGIITNLGREVERSGAKVVLSTDVNKATILQAAPEVLILATGSTPRQVKIEGQESAQIFNAWQVLEGANLGNSVIITDFRGDWIGIGLAERLANAGHRVRYFTSGHIVGQSLQSYLRDLWVGELQSLGVQTTTHARLAGVDANTAYFQHTASGAVMEVEEVDSVVLALGNQREAGLQDELDDFGGELHVIGDCLAPRTAEEAVFEGLQVGNAI